MTTDFNTNIVTVSNVQSLWTRDAIKQIFEENQIGNVINLELKHLPGDCTKTATVFLSSWGESNLARHIQAVFLSPRRIYERSNDFIFSSICRGAFFQFTFSLKHLINEPDFAEIDATSFVSGRMIVDELFTYEANVANAKTRRFATDEEYQRECDEQLRDCMSQTAFDIGNYECDEPLSHIIYMAATDEDADETEDDTTAHSIFMKAHDVYLKAQVVYMAATEKFGNTVSENGSETSSNHSRNSMSQRMKYTQDMCGNN